MRDVEWQAVQHGDYLKYLPEGTVFEVIKRNSDGSLYACRQVSQRQQTERGITFTQTETLTIERNIPDLALVQPPNTTRAVLTGTFVSRNAQGDVIDVDVCPPSR